MRVDDTMCNTDGGYQLSINQDQESHSNQTVIDPEALLCQTKNDSVGESQWN